MLNKVTLMGRLTRDPELRYTPSSGVAVARYSLAVERSYAKQGEKKEADFFNIVVWNKPAEFASQYFKKGKMVVVAGRLQTNKWTDKDGQNRSTVEIIAEEQYFADSKSGSGEEYDNQSSFPKNTNKPKVNNDKNINTVETNENDFDQESDFGMDSVDDKDLPF